MSSDEASKDGAAKKAKRRRAERLLGELLPDTTADEADEGWSEQQGGTRDDEMRRDVPPHHG